MRIKSLSIIFIAVALFCYSRVSAQISATTSSTGTTCAQNNGTAAIYPSGGSGYTYHWSVGSTLDSVSGLAPGSYTVTAYGTPISDSIVKTVTITATAGTQAITMVISPNDSMCLGSTATITATGPSSGQYTWSGGPIIGPTNGATITIQPPAGSYTYSITWSSGSCFVIATQSVQVLTTPIILTYPAPAVICSPGLPATMSVSGATGGIYTWTGGDIPSGTSITGASITRSPAGFSVYTVNWTDGFCIATNKDSIIIDSIAVVVHHPNCAHPGIGSAAVHVACGGPFTYTWYNGAHGDSINNLAPGYYNVTAYSGTDSVVKRIVVGLIQSTNIILSSSPHILCRGDSVTLRANNVPTGGVVYDWSDVNPPPHSTDSIVKYAPTHSTIYYFDWSNGLCFFASSIYVVVDSPPTILVTPSNPAICPGQPVTFTASGSNFGTYSWTGGDIPTGTSVTGTVLTRSPTTNQNYALSWTDGSCVVANNTAAVTVGNTATVSITASANDTICLGSSNTLTGTIGAPGGTYIWTGGTLATPDTATSIIAAPTTSGSYTYTVHWSNGLCSGTANYSLVTYSVKATLIDTIEPTCGKNNGTIHCSATGNSFLCTFLKGGVVVQQGAGTQLTNVGPGTYTFIVHELITGCTDTVHNITLTDTTSIPFFANIAINPETCFGDKNGSINVTTGNCGGNCTYGWSQDATNHTDSATHLRAGTYIFTIGNGVCNNIDTHIVVPGPATKVTNHLILRTDYCNQHIGFAIDSLTGGTGPFTYFWSAGTPTGDSTIGLAGDSTVYVIAVDSHGCADTSHGVIGNTGYPTGTISGPDFICFKENNGRLIVTPTSNDGPYTYQWTNGSTTQAAGGLAVGSYDCIIYNVHHCPTTLTGMVMGYDTGITMLASAYNLYLGQTEQITVQTLVKIKDVIWTPYVPGSRGQSIVYDKPTSDTTIYWVTVYYGESCTLTDSVAVYVFPDTARITVPNTFTPNGDGLNDEYYVSYNTPPIQDFHIWIYDRWGNKVYESTDKDFHWKGVDIYTGNTPLNSGVFAYVIEYHTYDATDKKTISGNITLVK